MYINSVRKRLGTWIIGHGTYQLLDKSFDCILYPAVIYLMKEWLGASIGVPIAALIMTLLSLIICFRLIKIYDWLELDMLGIESIKQNKNYEGKNIFRKLFGWIITKGDWAMFVYLSIWWDPFITTIYMRHGTHQYNGMSSRDRKIFFASIIFSNFCWTGLMLLGISGFEQLFVNN